jgi:pimeloyl-ACP methyl ester carboxylesterase
MPEEISVPLPDGVRLYAEAYGDQSAPVTVLMLHGWTLDRHIWHRQVTALTSGELQLPAHPPSRPARIRVVVYDARGHGRSDPARRRTATLPQLGDDLAAVVQAVASGPVVLAGHSLGGMTIMEYAHRHPEDFAHRVAGLVLVSTTAEGVMHTSYGLPQAVARVVRITEVAGAQVLACLGTWRPHRMLQLPLRPGLRWLLFGDVADPADVRLTMTSVAGTGLCAIGGFRSSVGAQRRLETLAALAPLPTTVLVGDRDRLTPRACAEAIAGAVPGAELVISRGGGHMLTLERPAEVTSALVAVCRAAVTGVPSAG